MGINPDESPSNPGAAGPYRQSQRKDIYLKHAQLLVKSGNAYLAFDTAAELENLREVAAQKGERFIYNWENRNRLKNSLSLSADEVAELIENKAPERPRAVWCYVFNAHFLVVFAQLGNAAHVFFKTK